MHISTCLPNCKRLAFESRRSALESQFGRKVKIAESQDEKKLKDSGEKGAG